MSEFRLERINRHRFEKSSFDKAIIVTGATENHAFHLPMGTDTFAAYAVAEATAAKTPGALLLPAMPFGVSDGLMPYPFTITVRPETLAAVIFEAVESCVVQGIEHFLIVNGHGGNNSAIDIACRRVKREYPQAKIAISYDWWISGPKLCPPGTFGRENGLGHAGEAETATALAVAPDCVDMDIARGEWPSSPIGISLRTTIPETSATGATGEIRAMPGRGSIWARPSTRSAARRWTTASGCGPSNAATRRERWPQMTATFRPRGIT